MGQLTKTDLRRFEIDLERSRAPRAFRDAQNLWREDIRRIHRLIERQVVSLKEWELKRERVLRGGGPEPDDERPHLSIAIFGPSGSGKSSLIRTLADDVRRKSGQILPERLDSNVATLPVMDPTTWAPTDQFLYAFLAAALEEERDVQQRKEHGYPQGLSPVQLSFQEVNEYLRVVDEPERSEEHDPLGLSLQKLERHTSGLRLRTALGKLVEELAKEFRSEVVLLPVDDLDMAPAHLVGALQSYQSFLAHPRLIPIFTFTDRMPEELIEVYYARSMGGAASHERLGGTNRLSISEQMAVQFLARCFPVRNRIRLGPAPARVQRALYSSRSTTAEPGKKPEQAHVSELLIQSSFLLFGHPDGEDFHQIRAALRPSTLRRQFQVVDAMSDCRLWALRTPQFAAMAGLSTDLIAELADSKSPELTIQKKDWADSWHKDFPIRQIWPDLNALVSGRELPKTVDETRIKGYKILARRMKELDIGATWATVFNGAAWSLLNVHRDTLRELGLFLEDLYSWTPRELRSVVLENILAQDQVTRRTVVDRWFNRTDYRRSQVLSLLAANIYRPWLPGEEPYGDEEIPLQKQLELDQEILERLNSTHGDKVQGHPLDSWHEGDPDMAQQIRDRLTIPGPAGLLWFLNVTLGFYLPQIMARNWGKALPNNAPIKSRMGGNGWDLHQAATNAIRIADDKQEIFSFGMLFLDPTAFRRALEVPRKWTEDNPKTRSTESFRDRVDEQGSDASSRRQMWRRHLQLRIWSCCGYSSGRYWAAFSLWRGLGFIGQVLEIGIRHEETLSDPMPRLDNAESEEEKKKLELKTKRWKEKREALHRDLFRLVRAQGLKGLVPGFLLSKDANDLRLLHGFLKWEPRAEDIENEIENLTQDLIKWLEANYDDCIFPLPAGDNWLGWKDCFIRRIHGEYILGGLWPRLNSAYLEEHSRVKDWAKLGRSRSLPYQSPDGKIDWEETPEQREPEGEKYRWAASLAAGSWSDLLLEYWRGCPPILKLLLTCPVMFRSNERFGLPDSEISSETQEHLRDLCFEELSDSDPGSAQSQGLSLKERVERLESKFDAQIQEETKRLHAGKRVTKLQRRKVRDRVQGLLSKRLYWLDRLGLAPKTWSEILEFWKSLPADKGAADNDRDYPGLEWTLVPSELAIPRIQTDQFATPTKSHHAVHLEDARFTVEDPVPSKKEEASLEDGEAGQTWVETKKIRVKPGYKAVD